MNRSLFPLIGALICFLILGAGYLYWYHSVSALSANAAALAQEIDDKRLDASRAAGARRALDSIASDEAALDSHFVSPTNIVSFLEGLERTGTALGSAVTVGSVSAEQVPRPHLALSLAIKGSFASVMRTLGAIEYGPQDIQVVSLTLDAVPGTAGSIVWTAAATLSVGMETVIPKP